MCFPCRSCWDVSTRRHTPALPAVFVFSSSSARWVTPAFLLRNNTPVKLWVWQSGKWLLLQHTAYVAVIPGYKHTHVTCGGQRLIDAASWRKNPSQSFMVWFRKNESFLSLLKLLPVADVSKYIFQSQTSLFPPLTQLCFKFDIQTTTHQVIQQLLSSFHQICCAVQNEAALMLQTCVFSSWSDIEAQQL